MKLPFQKVKRPVHDFIRAVEGSLDPLIAAIDGLGYNLVAANVKEYEVLKKGKHITVTIQITGMRE